MFELASGCRSILFGVKTMSGLRHKRRAWRRSMWKYCAAVEGWQICMLSSAASCMKRSRRALGVLSRQANRSSFHQQGSVGESFCETVIHGPLPITHFDALVEQFGDLGMHVEAFRNAHQAIGQSGERLARQSRIHFIFRLV